MSSTFENSKHSAMQEGQGVSNLYSSALYAPFLLYIRLWNSSANGCQRVFGEFLETISLSIRTL